MNIRYFLYVRTWSVNKFHYRIYTYTRSVSPEPFTCTTLVSILHQHNIWFFSTLLLIVPWLAARNTCMGVVKSMVHPLQCKLYDFIHFNYNLCNFIHFNVYLCIKQRSVGASQNANCKSNDFCILQTWCLYILFCHV
jgi:hypothetical protein